MNPILRNSAAHVFVAHLDNPELAEDDAHHLVRVLRIKDGETITICDGNGSWRTATLSGGVLRATGAVVTDSVHPKTRIAFVPLKGDRAELIVQKVTEIGVDEIAVMAATTRSVVKWDDKKYRREVARYERIAREAAMQSRRTHLPTVIGPVTIAEVANSGYVVAEPGGDTSVRVDSIAIGPEGGFAPEEVALFDGRIDLGPTILRAETAAIVAAVHVASSTTMRG